MKKTGLQGEKSRIIGKSHAGKEQTGRTEEGRKGKWG